MKSKQERQEEKKKGREALQTIQTLSKTLPKPVTDKIYQDYIVQWAETSKLKRFLKKADIKTGLDEK